MKKQLVSAILASTILAAVVPAFAAANPFVDVPANHWSYDAVTKLAANGIIDGYGDGTFRGDRTMTRYEMAQIVAKALAKSDKMSASDKALADRLTKEFGDELTNLGVRVAALEKNQSSVKWGGELRIRNYDRNYDQNDKDDNDTKLRYRLTADAKVNDDIHVKTRLATENFDIVEDDAREDTKLEMDHIYVEAKLGGGTVQAGRFTLFLGAGLLYDEQFNGISFSKDKFFAALGHEYNDDDVDYSAISVKDINLGAAKLAVNYLAGSGDDDNTYWGTELGFDLGNLGMLVQYAQSDADDDPKAYRVDAKIGKSPFTLGYQRLENDSVTDESTLDWTEDWKGWDIEYSKTVAKNTSFAIKYSDMEKISADDEVQEIMTTLKFKF